MYIEEYNKEKKVIAQSKTRSTEGKSRNTRVAKHDRMVIVQRPGGYRNDKTKKHDKKDVKRKRHILAKAIRAQVGGIKQ